VVAALALMVGLLASGFAGATTAPGQAGGSFTTSPPDGSTEVASAGTGDVQVTWSASCPNPAGDQFHYWYVESKAFHQDGSTVNYHSTAESDGSKTSDSSTDGLVLTMAQGLQVETFRIEVHLTSCNGVQDQLLGTSSVTLTRRSCDGSLYGKAQREFDLADEFHKLGVKELAQAWATVKTFGVDYAKETAQIGLEKYDALQALRTLSVHFFEVVEVGVVALGVLVTVEEITLKGIPLWADYVRDVTAAKEDLARGEAWAAKAKADMANASPCLDPIEGQLNKLLADQKRNDEARRIINTWENNGILYRNPISHELFNEAAALKHAKAQLTGGPSKRPFARAAAKSVKANAAQVRGAIKYLNQAQGYDRALRRNVAGVTAADATAVTQLRAWLASNS
jgi:hypothetical protein